MSNRTMYTLLTSLMFGIFKPISSNDRTLDVLEPRKQGDQLNIDLVSYTSVVDGETLTTRFGIQGQSDHLARMMSNRRDNAEATEQASAQFNADCAAAVHDLPLVTVDRDCIPVAS